MAGQAGTDTMTCGDKYSCYNRHHFSPCGYKGNTTDAGCVGCQGAIDGAQAQAAIPPDETAQQRVQRTHAIRWGREWKP